jgi:predicted Zn finger-like uncharacterized protein
MLFTRCPDCDTTFRVTDDALKKANGQVRCGRCASVFNAYAELREPPPNTPSSTAAAPVDERPPAAAPTTAAPSTATARDAAAESIGTDSVADVVAQVEIGVTDENAETGEQEVQTADDNGAITALEVQEVLAADGDEDSDAGTPDWRFIDPDPRRRNRGWGVAALLALVALGLQGLHHFRATLAGHAVVGPLVQQAYGRFGATVIPNWDVRQYEILDWVANAEPNAGGQGSLKITARIQNHGPQRQPYPAVHLRLKDRWEAAVGSRIFAPAEYLNSGVPRGRLMAPGETTRAEIEVVDPGPDAYGFELDVCIEIETDVLSCGTDKVFL